MPVNDLLMALWEAVERTADVERELRTTADQVAAWRQVAEAAVRALDHEVARHREADAARKIA